MKVLYYTMAQAEAICAAHQSLVGRPFHTVGTSTETIASVIVAPYSRILQWKFIQMVHQGTPMHMALSITPIDRFDVIVIMTQPEGAIPQSHGIKSIRSYFEEQQLPFNPSTYKPAK